jgi:hypothetical protein
MGGSSKQTIGYWYWWAICFGWCKGPVDAFLEFRGGDKTAWQGRLTASGRISINKPNLWGGEDNTGGGSGGIVGEMDVMFGEADQAPNDYLISTFGPQQSGRRGKFCTVFRGGKFGAFVANPKPVSAKIERILADWQDDTPWYPEKANIDLSGAAADSELGPLSTGWRYLIVALTDTADYSADDYDDSAWSLGQMPFASAAGQPFAEAAGFPAIMNTEWPVNTRIWLRRTFTVGSIADVVLEIFIDNFATVWVNGELVLDATNTTESAVTFTVPASVIRQGENVLVLRGDDDAEVSAEDFAYAAFKLVATSSISLFAMNPAHILYDSLTHADLQGEPTGAISDASFRAAADKLYSEGFGLCTDYDSSQETPKQFQQRICNVIGASLSQSRVDGLYYLDLIRGDYDLDSLPIIGEDDILSFSQDPSVITETGNKLSLEWFDPQAKETRTTPPVYSMGNIRSAGRVIPAETKKYPEIPVESLALRVAARDLKSTAVPLNKFDLSTRATQRGLRPGMNARLQVPSEGIADMVVVIGSVAHGTATKGDMKIVAVQNVYSMPSSVYVKPQDGLWAPDDTVAVPVPHQTAMEAPYVELAASLSAADLSALTDDAGYLLAAGTKPTSGINYLLTTAATGEDYADHGFGDWCPTATVNEAALEPDTAFTLGGASLIDRVAVGSWALWDSEIVRVDAIDVDANTVTFGRGCADTVPAQHDAGARIFFCGDWGSNDQREYVGGDVVEVKLLTRLRVDQLDTDDAAAMSVTMDDRQSRPYPPGKLQVNGLTYPSAVTGGVVSTWAHRDRLIQADQIIDTLQGDVGPEAGVTYTVRYYQPPGVLVASESAISGTGAASYTFPTDGQAAIGVSAVRDGVESLQAIACTFDYATSSVSYRITEAGDRRITEAGDARILEFP